MKIVNLKQGSPEWLAHRAKYDNASDAPAMMGCSPYKTRSQLLRERSTGVVPDVGPEQQRRYDDGHRFEALARPLMEEVAQDTLYPCVGVEGTLSMSSDGLTLDFAINSEHKTINDELRAAFDAIDAALAAGASDADAGRLLPLHYRIQMDHQMLVSGAEKTLFMATKWVGDSLDEERHCWYYPDLELRAKIVAGWQQFHRDLEAYVPTEAVEPAKAEVIESLPAPSVRIDGALVVAGNLPSFAIKVKEYIARIPARPATDNDFATCDAACKELKKAEDALDAAEKSALSSVADVEAMMRAVADCRKLMRDTRLAAEKLVESRKKEIKEQAVLAARKALDAHVAKLNAELAPMGLHLINADFAEAIKGKRSVASMQDALDTTLANAKIEADAQAAAMRHNINVFKAAAAGYEFLFADLHVIVHKAADDFATLVDSRVAAHKAAEQRRKEAEEAARQKAEAERLEREAEAKRKAQEAVDTALRLAQARAGDVVRVSQDFFTGRSTAQPEQVGGQVDGCRAPESQPDVCSGHVTQDDKSLPAPPNEPATLKLGEICTMFGVTMTAAFVADTLGVPHRATDKAAKLYRQSDVALIGRALQRHIGRAIELQAA